MPESRSVLSWRGRIGRRDFAVALMSQAFIAAIFASSAALLALLELRSPTWLVLGAMIGTCGAPTLALLVRRGHDLGWPAGTIVFFLGWAAFMLAVRFMGGGMLGADIANSGFVMRLNSLPLELLAFAPLAAQVPVMLTYRGQPEENQFGPPP